MLDAAKTGELVRREGPFELESMRAWGVDRSVNAGVLRHLLVAEQWQVHAKGVRLQGVLISGQLDLESATLRCPLRLDSCYLDNDGPVVLDYATASVLVLTGCHMAGLKADTLVVTRELNLTGTTFTGPVWLLNADITGQLSMTGAQLTRADKNGNALTADTIKVGGGVFLDSSGDQGTFTAAGAVRLVGADITGQLSMTGAQLTGTGKNGDALTADTIKVGGGVLLDSFTAVGAVRLIGADITGQLSMRGAQLTGTDKNGNALAADTIKVGGDVLLDSAGDQGTFTAAGAVRLAGADITGQLSMRGAQLTGTNNDGNALTAGGLKVGGGVLLDSAGDKGTFTAGGAVLLVGADITGQLSMRGAQLTGTDDDGNALTADTIKVGGDVLLDSAGDKGTFTAARAVLLAGADITGQLSMRGAQLTGTGKKGDALTADGLKVGGDVFLDSSSDQGTFTAVGAVSLPDARIGGSLYLTGADLKAEAGSTALDAEGIQITRKLAWRPTKPVLGQVNLEGGSAAELDDDWTGPRFKQNGYWPPDARLDGFTYTMIRADNKAGVDQRLGWIRGSNKEKTRRRGHGKDATTATGPAAPTDAARVATPDPDRPAFASGPYEQLLKMYQQAGDDTAAREVAINQRRDQRKLGNLKWYRKLFNWLLDITIGYGYRTWGALWSCSAAFTRSSWRSP